MMTNTTINLIIDVTNSSPAVTCEEADRVNFIAQLPLLLVAGLVNVIVWLAATVYKNKLLRQNNVYLCVTSTLLSNLGLIALHVWEIFGSLYPIGGLTGNVLWAVCQCAASAMIFVMCWNLCALIYVMLDGTYFHSASKQAYDGIQNPSTKIEKFLSNKRRIALILIAMAWLAPLLLTTFAVLYWNCAFGIHLAEGERCLCGPGKVDAMCPISEGCSRVFPPLKVDYWTVNVALWFVEVIALTWFTWKGVKNFKSFTGRSATKSVIVSDVTSGKEENNSLDVSNNLESNDVISAQQSIAVNRNILKSWSAWNPRLKLATLLTISFVVGTLPAVVAFFIDKTVDDYDVFAAQVSAVVCIHVYVLLCPILLVSYLPNLRAALARLFTGLLFCCS